jgi:hypothetical protein
MSDCDRFQQLLAARVFSALEPSESVQVDLHLLECEDCQANYAKLAELPGFLDFAGPGEPSIQTPPMLLEASVLAALERPSPRRRWRREPAQRRHSNRWRVAVASFGVALLAVAVVVTSGMLTTPTEHEHSTDLTMLASPQAFGAHAVVDLHDRPWGTEVELKADHLAPTHGAEIYEVWFVAGGGRISAGTFSVGPSGKVVVQLACGADSKRYESIGITREPDAIDPRRRGPNILAAQLPI